MLYEVTSMLIRGCCLGQSRLLPCNEFTEGNAICVAFV